MADNELDPLQVLGLRRKIGDQSGKNQVASLELLKTTKTNIIMREQLAQYAIVCRAAYDHLATPVYEPIIDKNGVITGYNKVKDDWDWMDHIITRCEEYAHNLDGLPREQFIRGLMADAAIQAEADKRARSMMDMRPQE